MAFLTVFTPTYNRGYLLNNLFESLLKQNIKNFEWIIVDDESTDDTEKIISEWSRRNNNFPIRYLKQQHGGKHRAINKGIKLAKGKFFFIVDSDDSLIENATELVEKWCKEIEDRKDIAGVSGMKISKGLFLGGDPKIDKGHNWVEASNLEREKYHLGGDKAEVYKTDILKKYSFPEFEGEYFITEAVCWNAIAADGYKIRWYSQPIYQCEYLEDGLTKNDANGISGSIENYKGYCYYISQCLKVKNVWGWSGNLRQYNKVAKALKKNWKQRADDLKITNGKYMLIRLVVFPCVYTAKFFYKSFCMLNVMFRKRG